MKVFMPDSMVKMFDGPVIHDSLVDVVTKSLYGSLVGEINQVSLKNADAYVAPDILSRVSSSDGAHITDKAYRLLYFFILSDAEEIASYDPEERSKLFAIAALNLLHILEVSALKAEILEVLRGYDCDEEDIKKLVVIAKSAANNGDLHVNKR